MKKLLLLIIVLLAVGAGVVLTMKDSFVKSKIHQGLEALLGTSVELGEMTLDMKNNHLAFDFLQVKNPEGFTQPVLANVSEINLHCDIKKLVFSGEYQCTKASAIINEVYIERTVEQKVNLAALNAMAADVVSKPTDSAERRQSGFMIERLELTIKNALLFESVKGQPIRKLKANLTGKKEVYGFLTDPNALIYIPTVKILFNLKRGSLGLPRSGMQQKIVATTGKL